MIELNKGGRSCFKGYMFLNDVYYQTSQWVTEMWNYKEEGLLKTVNN